MDNTRFYTVDVEKVDDFADVAHATKLPCFFIFKDGKRHGMVQGANLPNLVTEIKKIN